METVLEFAAYDPERYLTEKPRSAAHRCLNQHAFDGYVSVVAHATRTK